MPLPSASDALFSVIKSEQFKLYLADLNECLFNRKQEDPIRDRLVIELNKQRDLFALSKYPKSRISRLASHGVLARAEVDLSILKKLQNGLPDFKGGTFARVELKQQYPGDMRGSTVLKAIVNDMSRISLPGLMACEEEKFLNGQNCQQILLRRGMPTTHFMLIIQERKLHSEGFDRIGALTYIPAHETAEKFSEDLLSPLHAEMKVRGIVVNNPISKHMVEINGKFLQSRYHFYIYDLASC